MKIERIKELFFLSMTNYPFPSNELYLFFGFNRHDNFIRLLKKDKYNSDVTIKSREKIKQRRNDVYYITKDLFYTLCQRYLKDYSTITQIYLDFKRSAYKQKILNFANSSRKQYIKLDIFQRVKGHFYTYMLNTVNVAKDLNIDVYDLFKFCSREFCSKYKYVYAKCERETTGGASYPYYTFDSLKHEERFLFLIFIKTIKEKYKLTSFQIQLIEVYSDFIKQMLERQLEYDIKEHRRTENHRASIIKFNFKFHLTKEQQSELKALYRKAAMLCHPDKNKNGEEIFKDLNNANQNNNLQKVKEIFSRLS